MGRPVDLLVRRFLRPQSPSVMCWGTIRSQTKTSLDDHYDSSPGGQMKLECPRRHGSLVSWGPFPEFWLVAHFANSAKPCCQFALISIPPATFGPKGKKKKRVSHKPMSQLHILPHSPHPREGTESTPPIRGWRHAYASLPMTAQAQRLWRRRSSHGAPQLHWAKHRQARPLLSIVSVHISPDVVTGHAGEFYGDSIGAEFLACGLLSSGLVHFLLHDTPMFVPSSVSVRSKIRSAPFPTRAPHEKIRVPSGSLVRRRPS